MSTISALRPFSDLLDAVETVARELPDRTATADYFVDGQPVCIFGHAFARLGVEPCPDPEAPELFWDNAIDEMDLRRVGFAEPGDDALAWAREVQRQQDNGTPWALAVMCAGDRP